MKPNAIGVSLIHRGFVWEKTKNRLQKKPTVGRPDEGGKKLTL